MQKPYSVVANSNGDATITVRPPGNGWVITQVSLSMEAGSASEVSPDATGLLKYNGVVVDAFVAQGGSVGGDPPLELWPGDEMTAVWATCNPGNVCRALVFYTPRP